MLQKITYGFIQLFIIIILTIITQVGGIIYLLCTPLFRYTNRNTKTKLNSILLKTFGYLVIYIGISFTIIPPLAKLNDRVPLPTIIQQDFMVCPLSYITVLGNRHYVSTDMYKLLKETSTDYQKIHSGSIISYLDANFPFMDGFPLIPHLSHNDGEKVDLAFMYVAVATGEKVNNKAPSPMGYGIYEEPKADEYNQAKECEANGYKQYSYSKIFGLLAGKRKLELDENRTADLVSIILANGAGKIFIEPHLKTRMGLYNDKIRFHGCHAVRHDDHIHIQL